MKKGLALVLALIFYVSILPPLSTADLIKGNFSDIITKSPWVDVRAFGITGTGDEASKLQAAIDSLPSTGGTILIPISFSIGSPNWTGISVTKNGTKIQCVNNSTIKILARPVVNDYDGGSVVTGLFRTAFVFSNVSDPAVDGCTFDGGGLELGFIGAFYTDGFKITNNTFKNTGTIGPNPHGTTSVGGYANTKHSILNNTWDNTYTSYGMGVGFVNKCERNATIEGNKFINQPDDTLQTCLINSVISGNLWDNAAIGVNLGGATEVSKGVAITGNTLRNISGLAMRGDLTGSLFNSGISISGNTIDNAETGIAITGLIDSSITGNTLTNIISYGIGSNDWDNIIISSNYVRAYNDNGMVGIHINGYVTVTSSHTTISNNIVSGFNRQSTCSGIWIDGSGLTTQRHIVTGNQLYGNNTGFLQHGTTDNVLFSNNISLFNTNFDVRLDDSDKKTFGSNNIYSLFIGHPIKTFIGKTAYYTKSSVPTDNAIACAVGDIVWNTGSDNVLGWKCTVAGSPGTWGAMTVTMP